MQSERSKVGRKYLFAERKVGILKRIPTFSFFELDAEEPHEVEGLGTGDAGAAKLERYGIAETGILNLAVGQRNALQTGAEELGRSEVAARKGGLLETAVAQNGTPKHARLERRPNETKPKTPSAKSAPVSLQSRKRTR